MSKTNLDENLTLNELNLDQNSIQLKKLRFHPYYYQGRKGSLYFEEKRTNIKIIKIEKGDSELILTLSGKKSIQKFELKGFWDQITFDYYSISNSKDWKVVFSKK